MSLSIDVHKNWIVEHVNQDDEYPNSGEIYDGGYVINWLALINLRNKAGVHKFHLGFWLEIGSIRWIIE